MQNPVPVTTPDAPEAFPVVEEGYACENVDIYLSEVHKRLAEMQRRLELAGPNPRAKDVFVRSITTALGSAYDVLDDAGREAAAILAEAQKTSEEVRDEVERHREELEGLDKAWEQLEVGRAELRQFTIEIESSRSEEIRLLKEVIERSNGELADAAAAHRLTLVEVQTAADERIAAERIAIENEMEEVRAAAATEAAKMRSQAEAEAEALRVAAQAAASEVLSAGRESEQRLQQEREHLAMARQRADQERRSYLELKHRLEQRWNDLSEIPPAVIRDVVATPDVLSSPIAPDGSAVEFDGFFSDEVEDEPSRAWMFGHE